MPRIALLLGLVAGVAACGPRPPEDPAAAAQRCEQRARAAQGPTGSVSIGVSSSEGPRAGATVGLSSDYLRGRDPVAVYEECVYRATGQAPIRPPRLR